MSKGYNDEGRLLARLVVQSLNKDGGIGIHILEVRAHGEELRINDRGGLLEAAAFHGNSLPPVFCRRREKGRIDEEATVSDAVDWVNSLDGITVRSEEMGAHHIGAARRTYANLAAERRERDAVRGARHEGTAQDGERHPQRQEEPA